MMWLNWAFNQCLDHTFMFNIIMRIDFTAFEIIDCISTYVVIIKKIINEENLNFENSFIT